MYLFLTLLKLLINRSSLLRGFDLAPNLSMNQTGAVKHLFNQIGVE